jgi:hypothetical protein
LPDLPGLIIGYDVAKKQVMIKEIGVAVLALQVPNEV